METEETKEEINTLKNKVFRLECEQLNWRKLRTMTESFLDNHSMFGFNTQKEIQELKEQLESIKYY